MTNLVICAQSIGFIVLTGFNWLAEGAIVSYWTAFAERRAKSEERGAKREAQFRWGRFAAGCAALLWLVGCEGDPPVTSDEDIENVSYEELQGLLAKDQSKHPVVLVDVRSPEKFALAHVQYAINIPLADLAANDPRLGGDETTIVVYSGGWEDRLSQAAWKKLVYNGYERVLNYRGGLFIWQKQGGEVVKLE